MSGAQRQVLMAAAVAVALAAAALSAQSRPAAGSAAESAEPPAAPALAQAPDQVRPPFAEWLSALRDEAVGRGIRAETVDRAFEGVELLEVVVERDRTQAEFTLSLDQYLTRRLTTPLVRRARENATGHRSLLQRVGTAYGVPPPVLVAIWGLESNFGRFSGVRPTIGSLATLAYEPRRSTLFREELISALQILDQGDIELTRMKGSWAGAMGQPQFMPSSYLQYAQDFDGDGRRDVWSSEADVLASIAHYLRQHGWSGEERWGWEVLPPEGTDSQADPPLRATGCRAEREMSEARPVGQWRERGIRLKGAKALPAMPDTSLVRAGARAFLVSVNYEALLAYNCAHSYALSVGLLADRIPWR